MKFPATLCLAFVLANLSPVAAQACGDDVAGLSVDDDGKYVASSEATGNSAQAATNMSVPPQAPAAQNMSVRPDAPRSVLPVERVEVQPSAPLPATTTPEEAASQAEANPEKAPNPSGPSAMLPAPWRMAQAATGTAPAQSSTGAATNSSSTEAAPKPRHHKKTAASGQPAQRSGAAIVKEGGKTCSGLDEYRVCW